MPKIDLTSHFQKKTAIPWVDLTESDQCQLTMYETARDVYLEEVVGAMLTIPAVNKVFENIHIGTALAASDPDLLRELDIYQVLNMANNEEYDVPDDITVTKIGIRDGEISPDDVFLSAAEILNILNKSNENVLVHCSAGISRSTTAVVSYLIKYRDIGFIDALFGLQASRKCCSPDPLLVRSALRDLKDDFVW